MLDGRGNVRGGRGRDKKRDVGNGEMVGLECWMGGVT